MRQFVAYLKLHPGHLVYMLGGLFIACWTLLRFFTQRTIFDLVGQQVMTQQWLDGHFAGGSLGVTNYILKMIFLYMPLDLLPGSPRIGLLVLTLLVNLAAFVLIGVLAQRILRYFGIRSNEGLYAGLIWLAMAAGSVFWIQFTNSRNLEVAGGLLLLYGGLCYLRQPTNKLLLGLTAYSGLLFFADNLQAYMTAAPLLAYAALTGRRQMLIVARLALSLGVGFVISKELFVMAAALFSVDFITVGQATHLSAAFITDGVKGSVTSVAHLLLGGADAGRLRQIVNGVFLVAVVAAASYAAWKRLVSRRLLLLLGLITVTDISVYILSGQAQQAATERYLIMLAPVIVLLAGAAKPVISKYKKIALVGFGLIVLINAAALGVTLTQKWDTHFSQDSHLRSVQSFIAKHTDMKFYGSMDTALPLAYLTGSYTHAPLPLTCNANGLFKTNTFYTKSAYKALEQKTAKASAIILDGASITNVPSVCNEDAIIIQLGTPTKRLTMNDGSAVLIYETDAPLQY